MSEVQDAIARAEFPVKLEGLFQKATSGDTTSLIWWTKTQMKWSETVKAEVTGADGEPLQGIQVTFVKPNE